MHPIRIGFLSLFVIIRFISYGQYFKIDLYEETHSSGEVYTFPILKLASNPSIARKINEQLQKAELSAVIDPVKKGAFKEIWPHGANGIGGTSEYSFVVIDNNARFITISFSGQGCGAYCEGFTTRYNFNSKTGADIRAPDLFTVSGKSFVGQFITSTRNKLITDIIKELKTRQKSGSAEEKQYAADAIEMYTTCRRSEDIAAALEYESLQLDEQKIFFYSDRCSNHALAALDEIGEFVYELPISDFTLCLSRSGHQLLDTKLYEIATGRYLKGTINNSIKISVLLKLPEEGEIEGLYFYNRIAGIIHMNGNKKGSTISLTERDANGNATGQFDLTLTGNLLTGKWTHPTSGKMLPVKLAVN